MLRIRLLRVGKKNQPIFRIVVTEKTNPPRGGRFLEILGFYNPISKEKSLKQDRIKYWLSVGAQPSDTVHNLLVSEKVVEGRKLPVHKKKKGKEGPAVEKVEAKEKVKAAEEPIMKKSEAESPKKEEKEEVKEPEKKPEEKPEKPQEEKPKEPEKKKEGEKLSIAKAVEDKKEKPAEEPKKKEKPKEPDSPKDKEKPKEKGGE